MEQPPDSKDSMGLIVRHGKEMETDRKREGGRRRDRDKWTLRQTDRRVKENMRKSNRPIRIGSMDWELYRVRNYSLVWCTFEPQYTLASLAVSLNEGKLSGLQ